MQCVAQHTQKIFTDLPIHTPCRTLSAKQRDVPEAREQRLSHQHKSNVISATSTAANHREMPTNTHYLLATTQREVSAQQQRREMHTHHHSTTCSAVRCSSALRMAARDAAGAGRKAHRSCHRHHRRNGGFTKNKMEEKARISTITYSTIRLSPPIPNALSFQIVRKTLSLTQHTMQHRRLCEQNAG